MLAACLVSHRDRHFVGGHLHVEDVAQHVGVSSLHLVDLRDQTQAGSLGGKCIYLLCHLTSPPHPANGTQSMVATSFCSVARTESKISCAGQALYRCATVPSIYYKNKVLPCIEEASCPTTCYIAEADFELRISCLILCSAGIIGLFHHA